MIAKIKEWGFVILGILIFVLSLIGLARRESKPQSDSAGVGENVTRQEVAQQNANAVEIEQKHNDVVNTVTKPIAVPPSKGIQEAIDRFNNS